MAHWIDVHTHLNFLEESPEEALEKARAAGVKRVITIGTEPKDHLIVLELSRRYYPEVSCTLGLHPHEAKLWSDELDAFIRVHAPEREVAAVGEIGLDYYYNNSPASEQIAAFRAQMQIAADLHMPVEIHTRDAEPDTVTVLEEFKGRVSGIIHCFTGTKWLAERALDAGWDISFSGVVTFKNAHELRDVARSVPLDRLHVETDAPFLAPVPQRGKKNTPAFVVHTAKVIAELRGLEPERLCEAAEANARRMFPKIQW